MSDFPERLEAELISMEMRPAHLARALGISHGTLSGWLSGTYRPQPRTLKALAAALGVRPEWLLNGEGPRTEGEALACLVVRDNLTSRPRESRIPFACTDAELDEAIANNCHLYASTASAVRYAHLDLLAALVAERLRRYYAAPTDYHSQS